MHHQEAFGSGEAESCERAKAFMSHIRLTRLTADYDMMRRLADSSELVSFDASGQPPDHYRVYYRCAGVTWDEARRKPVRCERFAIEIVLHAEYPKKRPGLRMLTPIFHPNIYNGGICTGLWSPATGLSHLCIQIGRMIQYRNYDLTDFLDEQARNWAAQHAPLFPIDDRDFSTRLSRTVR